MKPNTEYPLCTGGMLPQTTEFTGPEYWGVAINDQTSLQIELWANDGPDGPEGVWWTECGPLMGMWILEELLKGAISPETLEQAEFKLMA